MEQILIWFSFYKASISRQLKLLLSNDKKCNDKKFRTSYMWSTQRAKFLTWPFS